MHRFSHIVIETSEQSIKAHLSTIKFTISKSTIFQNITPKDQIFSTPPKVKIHQTYSKVSYMF